MRFKVKDVGRMSARSTSSQLLMHLLPYEVDEDTSKHSLQSSTYIRPGPHPRLGKTTSGYFLMCCTCVVHGELMASQKKRRIMVHMLHDSYATQCRDAWAPHTQTQMCGDDAFLSVCLSVRLSVTVRHAATQAKPSLEAHFTLTLTQTDRNRTPAGGARPIATLHVLSPQTSKSSDFEKPSRAHLFLCVRGPYYEYNGRGYAVLPGVDIRCHAS